jgi:trehalose 6-phosphate phosphatase
VTDTVGGEPIPALACWDRLATTFANHPLAVFLDYDGTLSPIVSSPELAVLPPGRRDLLARLANRYPVAILSGRGRADVASLVGLDRLVYAGSHGFDISGPPLHPGEPPLNHEVGPEIPAQIESAAGELAAHLSDLPGVLVEAKRFALAIHFRLAPDSALERIEGEVDAALRRYPTLRKTEGKKVFELRPRLAWDKGAALRWILAQLPGPAERRIPIYVGDDTTDEDGFAAAQAEGGSGFLVAPEPHPTAARFLLHDPDEVHTFLENLTELPR